MKLNFDALTQPLQKEGGTSGTGGTNNNGAASGCPTIPGGTWDTVGQTQGGNRENPKMSHLSHQDKNEVGQGKPCIYAAVPPVPPVPPEKETNGNEAEFRRHVLDDAKEFDRLIHRLCDLRGYPQAHREKLLQVRRRMAPADLRGDLEEFRLIVEKAKPGGMAA